ncbi:MAG: helix-turn-helix transcriptional regulator [Rhodospirillales bacterium]|nr:helix-turn-helix transcriptional regulator [Alphaproteobacteria bacterium]MCB9987028.1 helix-turn-helix transcriptional regulator [Rhodospirillales bacterium]USO08202.1 MAG: helix-turn-helix transcriptional regulator [Rhodospirillales bacterium]
MISHDTIWIAIDRLAESAGFSTSGLARKAGLDPTAFNRSKRISPEGKPRWPSTESISKVLQVTGASMSDFIALVETREITIHARPAGGPRAIPLIGLAQAGRDGYFDDAGFPVGAAWDEIRFPDTQSFDDNTYALEIQGDSMRPLYRDGDIVVVNPAAQLRKGDRVVVKTRRGEVMAKELTRKTMQRIELHSLNPDHDDRTLAAAEILWIARILWVSQ